MVRVSVPFLPSWSSVRLAVFLAVLIGAVPECLPAQATFGRVTRGDGEATLTVFDGRPLDLAAQTLASEFGIRINVEDPLYFWVGDLVESHRTATGKRVMVPKPLLLQVSFRLGSDGQPEDVPSLLTALTERMSVERPFRYRFSPAPGGYNVVPTAMRDEHGQLVPYSSPLDIPVSIPNGRRSIAVHIGRIIEAVKARAAYDAIGCCTPGASNVDQTEVEFGAENEPARTALERLLLQRPARARPAIQHMRCQPLERWCFVNWLQFP